MICETQEFVVNLVTEDLAKACDYCGVRSGSKEDKFEAMKLTAVPAPGMKYAPQIQESPVSLCCQVKDVIELGSHDLFLGEIKSVTVDEKWIDEKGKICLEKGLGKLLGFFGYSVASKKALARRMPPKKHSKRNTK